uniref:Uncharacterized protein n=1 Tax=Anguilla anguilla TaxID=7936 RepID=A0A0E9UWA2_ANGAN
MLNVSCLFHRAKLNVLNKKKNIK